MSTIINYTLKDLYKFFDKYFTNYTIIEFNSRIHYLLKKDSIMLDNESKKLISKDLLDKINDTIFKYDYCFIKFNDKSAIDAEFLVTQLKCFNIDHIITLIKGSERCLKTFNFFRKNYLILKEWYKIQKKFEFRCYIINKKLKGISQRYINFYENYEDILKIRKCIIDFYNNNLIECLNKFEINENENNFMIIDLIYLEKKNKCKIIDVEILGKVLKREEIEVELIEEKDAEKEELLKEMEQLKINEKKNQKKIKNIENILKEKENKLMQEKEEKEKLEKEIEEKNNEIYQNEEYLKNYMNSKLKLYSNWDELINVDDNNQNEIELKYITDDQDERIEKLEENFNKFPVELYESDFQTLLEKLNFKQ